MSRFYATLTTALWLFLSLMLFTPALSAQSTGNAGNSSPQNLSCSPAPCVLPNVRLPGRNAGNSSLIVVNPNDASQILVGVEDFTCTSMVGFHSSGDAGTTWTHTCIPMVDGVGGTVAGYDLHNTAYGGGIQDVISVVLRSSTDNGIHWGATKIADVDEAGISLAWLAVDDSVRSPFANTLYILDVHGTGGQVHVSHSSDGGQHWTGRAVDQSPYPAVDVYTHISLGDDGAVYVTWLRCKLDGPNHDCGETKVPILLSKSIDGGNSWSPPTIVAHTTLTPTFGCAFGYGCLPNTQSGVSNIPVSAIFGSGPTAKVYVVFYTWTGTQMQIEVTTSSDGGSTFGLPARVSTSALGDEFLAWISLSASGTVGVTWLDRRNDPGNLKYQPFFATSRDGLHFSPSRSLSTALSDPSNVGFLEDYQFRTHLWVGNAIYASWMDTRSGVERIELGGVQF